MSAGSTATACASPEVELVLLSAQRLVSPDQEARMRSLLAGRLDWDRLAEWAEFHKVVPAVASRIDAMSPDVVPIPIRK